MQLVLVVAQSVQLVGAQLACKLVFALVVKQFRRRSVGHVGVPIYLTQRRVATAGQPQTRFEQSGIESLESCCDVADDDHEVEPNCRPENNLW